MGAWGTGIFENDGSLDWKGELLDSKDGWALIRKSLTQAIMTPDGEYVSPSESEGALAAAECVAAALGKASANLHQDLVRWVRENPAKDGPDVAPLALKAVQRIRTSSELKELWDEAEDPEWNAVVADLEKRLTS